MQAWSVQKTLLIGVGLSALLHGSSLAMLGARELWKQEPATPVKIRIVEKKPEEPKVEPPPPPKPIEKKPPKKPEKKIASERTPPKEPPKDPPKPIQGLTEESFDKSGKGNVAAPLGNTMMMEDTGERVKEAPPPMDADLSSDPQLVRASVVTPQYTDAALDASFEGYVTVEVLVDETGKVTDAQLTKKVGYGMDQRILDAAYAARFLPRKNRLGRPEAGWTELRFNMEIP